VRIGIIAPEFPPDLGGVETYAYQYVLALRQMVDADIRVFTRRHRAGEISIPGVEVLPRLRFRVRHDRRLFAEQPIDVWHAMNAAYGWIGNNPGRALVSVHGNDFLRPYISLFKPDLARFLRAQSAPAWLEALEQRRSRRLTVNAMRRGLPRMQRILTNSRYTERVFLERFPECAGRTSAALVGVGAEFFKCVHKPRRSTDPLRLITVSRLSEPRKNVDLVLRALASTQHDASFTYRIIGEGTERDRLEALAADLGLATKVRFLGSLPQDQMVEELAASDLFVLVSSILPSSHEGFGIVYLEANAAGTPVLAARMGGAAEAVASGRSGYFVETPDVASIRDALRAFFDGTLVFDSNACREHAREFTWARVATAALPFYRP
jgi:phosphatidylinositol alpha-1,6-mannosyltransferase